MLGVYYYSWNWLSDNMTNGRKGVDGSNGTCRLWGG